MLSRSSYIVAFIIIFFSGARSQSLTDAVRLANEPIGTGARTVAMGGAGIASVNDYSALDWNPAALTLVNFGEINFSLYFRGHNSTASFLNTSEDQSVTNTALGSIGYVSAVPTSRGHLSFGISYDRILDYNTTYSFSAVNSKSSFLDTKGFINDNGNRFGLSTTDYRNFLYDNNLA